MPTAQRYMQYIQNNQSLFPEITYIKLNRHRTLDIISIFKLRTFTYNFQYKLSLRHINTQNGIDCACGLAYDELDHIFECTFYKDVFQELSNRKIFDEKDYKKLILYDQIYINSNFVKSKIPKIDKYIKNFHQKLLKKRIQILKIQQLKQKDKLHQKEFGTSRKLYYNCFGGVYRKKSVIVDSSVKLLKQDLGFQQQQNRQLQNENDDLIIYLEKLKKNYKKMEEQFYQLIEEKEKLSQFEIDSDVDIYN